MESGLEFYMGVFVYLLRVELLIWDDIVIEGLC